MYENDILVAELVSRNGHRIGFIRENGNQSDIVYFTIYRIRNGKPVRVAEIGVDWMHVADDERESMSLYVWDEENLDMDPVVDMPIEKERAPKFCAFCQAEADKMIVHESFMTPACTACAKVYESGQASPDAVIIEIMEVEVDSGS